MVLKDIIDVLKQKEGMEKFSKKDLYMIADKLFETITEKVLKDGQEVKIGTYGKFVPAKSNRTKGYNPLSGTTITYTPKVRMKFKPFKKAIKEE
jgi:nucleoid DNA-binding protein